MHILKFDGKDEALKHQMAQLLVDAFREHWDDAWETFEDGLKEIEEMCEAERIFLIAVDDGKLLGMIGGIPQYDGNVWELHPLAVQPSLQGKGVGRALVMEFEEQVKQRGGLTITLGSDDQDEMTSLAKVDLYVDMWDKIKNIQNFKGHPYEFYQKMGYVITGVVPDANGLGRPDIMMSKRVAKQ